MLQTWFVTCFIWLDLVEFWYLLCFLIVVGLQMVTITTSRFTVSPTSRRPAISLSGTRDFGGRETNTQVSGSVARVQLTLTASEAALARPIGMVSLWCARRRPSHALSFTVKRPRNVARASPSLTRVYFIMPAPSASCIRRSITTGWSCITCNCLHPQLTKFNLVFGSLIFATTFFCAIFWFANFFFGFIRTRSKRFVIGHQNNENWCRIEKYCLGFLW